MLVDTGKKPCETSNDDETHKFSITMLMWLAADLVPTLPTVR